MSATGIVISSDGDYRYTVAPSLSIAENISGISILKETLEAGQQVKVIQVGDDQSSVAEFGFCSMGADVTGIVRVSDAIKPPMIQGSPANFAAAYIAYKANKFAKFYETGTVEAIYLSDITVKYITGNSAGDSHTLPILGVDPADFVVGEVALIDKRQYGTDTVVGWWEILDELSSVYMIDDGVYSVGFFNTAEAEYQLKTLDPIPYSIDFLTGMAKSAGNKIYITGGTDIYFERVLYYVYDISLNTFSKVDAPASPNPMSFWGATTYQNKVIFTPGDFLKFGIMTDDSFSWGSATEPNIGFNRFDCPIADDNLYCCGGKNILKYNIAVDAISTKAAIPYYTEDGFATPSFFRMILSGKNLIILIPDTVYYNYLGIYNIDTDTFTQGPDVSSLSLSVGYDYGSKVFFIGNKIHSYDAITGNITEVLTVPVSVVGSVRVSQQKILTTSPTGFGLYDMSTNSYEVLLEGSFIYRYYLGVAA